MAARHIKINGDKDYFLSGLYFVDDAGIFADKSEISKNDFKLISVPFQFKHTNTTVYEDKSYNQVDVNKLFEKQTKAEPSALKSDPSFKAVSNNENCQDQWNSETKKWECI
jgi:hypothetical protein